MTEHLYVLGHPVGHSKSPAMHNAAYRALGLDWEYGLADRATEADAWEFLVERAWLALNITMPWKKLALQLTSDRGAAACLAHGANVLVNHDGRVYADNTDGVGCVAYLQRERVSFEGSSVCVCGTGPTSLAIMHACACAGAAHVMLLGRDAARCGDALDAYRDRLAGVAAQLGEDAAGIDPSSTEFESGSYVQCETALSESEIIIDATPLGMKPGDPAPFDTSLLSPGQCVFDVVYGHGETALLAAARATGCRAFDGAGMLVAQAVETVRIIERVTGLFAVPDDVDLFTVMRDAAFGQ